LNQQTTTLLFLLLPSYIIKRISSHGGLFGKLDKYFDSFSDVRFVDKTHRSKIPYSLVEKKKQYDNPASFFSPNHAKEIMKSHSLQADLHWTKRDNIRKGRDFCEMVLEMSYLFNTIGFWIC
jgi:hypothetical protein